MGVFGEDNLATATPSEGVLTGGQVDSGASQSQTITEGQQSVTTGQTAENIQQPTPGEEQPGQVGEETLLAGKFKSQDDLVKGYVNLANEFSKRGLGNPDELLEQAQTPEEAYNLLQSEFTRRNQEVRKLGTEQPQGQQLNLGQAPVVPQAQPAEQTGQAPDIDWEAYNKQFFLPELQANPAGAIMAIAEQVAERMVNEKLAPIQQKEQTQQYEQYIDGQLRDIQKDPDFPKLAGTMKQLMDQYPGIEFMPNGVKLLFQAAKSQNISQVVQQAKDMGIQEAQENQAMRNGAVMLTGGANQNTQSNNSGPATKFEAVFGRKQGGGIFG